MTATSGLKCYERFGRYSPLGSLLKTLLASRRWYNPAVSLKWDVQTFSSKKVLYVEKNTGTSSMPSVKTLSEKDMKSNRLLFQLVPQERPIEETVPCLISDHLCDIEQIKHGTVVDINGQFRSHNHRDQKEKRRKLQLNVFVMDIQFIEETNHEIDKIWLDGYLCKEPEYRVTPRGREVTDILVAVNRAYGKSDYIPCICWGRNAIYASGLKVGTYLQCKGRIQSRVFMKEGNAKTAYEVSLVSLKAIM